LETWASQGVLGHFKPLRDSPLPTWLDADDKAAAMMAPVIGADRHDIAIMQTLTANLHILMAAFYKPTLERHKIILEHKAFPSDHVRAIEGKSNLGFVSGLTMGCLVRRGIPNTPPWSIFGQLTCDDRIRPVDGQLALDREDSVCH
jgi:hypothetical protein